MSPLQSIVLLALLGGAGAACTAELTCTKEPRSKWLAREAVRVKVESQGYKVVDIDVEHACYVIEVRDKNGKEIDLHLHPVTGETVRREEDS
jgi:hypothetical protein